MFHPLIKAVPINSSKINQNHFIIYRIFLREVYKSSKQVKIENKISRKTFRMKCRNDKIKVKRSWTPLFEDQSKKKNK